MSGTLENVLSRSSDETSCQRYLKPQRRTTELNRWLFTVGGA